MIGTSSKSPMSGTSTETDVGRAHTVVGIGASGSISKRSIASWTRAGSIDPSSASSLSAATVT